MDVILTTLQGEDKELYYPALLTLLDHSKSDIASLKLLQDNREVLTTIYMSLELCFEKRLFSDILSYIYIIDDGILGLLYRLKGNVVDVGEFGHNYVKKLLSVIITNKANQTAGVNVDVTFNSLKDTYSHLIEKYDHIIQSVNHYISLPIILEERDIFFSIVIECLVFLFHNNAEIEALDFLCDFDPRLIPFFVDENNFAKIETYVNDLTYYDDRLKGVLTHIYRMRNDDVKLLLTILRFQTFQHEDGFFHEEIEYVDIKDDRIDNCRIYEPIDYSKSKVEVSSSNTLKKDLNKSGIYEPIDSSKSKGEVLSSSNQKKVTSNTIKKEDVKENYFKKEKIYSKGEKFYIFNFTEKEFEETLFFILKKCEINEFIQIIFNLNRLGLKMDDEKIIKIIEERKDERMQHRYSLSVNDSKDLDFIQNKNNEKINLEKIYRKIASNSFLSKINHFLQKDLQIIHPYPVEKYIKGLPKMPKELDTKRFAVYSIANSFVHFSFGFDSLYTTNLEYYLNYENIISAERIEILAILGSIGNIKKNSNYSSRYKVGEDSENSDISNEIYVISEKSAQFNDKLDSLMFEDGFKYKKLGALLAMAFQQNTYDSDHSLFSLLDPNLLSPCKYMRTATLLGIYSLYCNENIQDKKILDSLIPLLYDESIEVVGFTAFTIGAIYQGTKDKDLLSYLITAFLERKNESDNTFFSLIPLGAALLFKGQKEYENEAFEEFGSIFKGMAYLGTGKVEILEELIVTLCEMDDKKKDEEAEEALKKQEQEDGSIRDKYDNVDALKEIEDMLNDKKEENNISFSNSRAMLLISITLICLNDNHTKSIAKRLLINNIQNDKTGIIPLCLGLLYISDPDVEIIDCLSRTINSSDPVPSIIGLALISAGTNNTRIQGILEKQYDYFLKVNKIISALKIAQGIISLGKGTLTLSPFMFDKGIVNSKGITSLIGFLFLFINDQYPLLSKFNFLFFILSNSVNNKFAVTLNNSLEFIPINIRIGKPVNTVAMAGKHKSISAVVVHESPILIQGDEATEIYEEEGYTHKGYPEDVIVVSKKE